MGQNPTVDQTARASHEAAMQSRYPGYQITERAQGRLVRAGERPSYVVVQHIAPFAGNEAALGYDISSEPTRARAINRARDTGEQSLTGPIHLVQEQGDELGFLALQPVGDMFAVSVFPVPMDRSPLVWMRPASSMLGPGKTSRSPS